MTAPIPGGTGGMRAFQMALDDAGLNPEDVDYINAHGTSTHLNDLCETQAIKALFGDHARKMAISSTKGAMGHGLGAAGGFETIIASKAIETGIIPPTINYTTPDPECDLDYTPNVARERKVDVAINTNLGFGGIWGFPGSSVWRRQWHPIPVLLPGKSHGRRSLVGCSPC